MSKGGVIVLIIAAIVFTGLGFVIGNVVVAAGSNPGSKDDPVMTQKGVEQLMSVRIGELEEKIESLEAMLDSANPTGGDVKPGKNNDNDDKNTNDEEQHVKVKADSVNVRSSASTSADVLASVTSGTELVYLGSTSSSDGTWYHVEMSDGSEGYVAGWLCSDPY